MRNCHKIDHRWTNDILMKLRNCTFYASNTRLLNSNPTESWSEDGEELRSYVLTLGSVLALSVYNCNLEDFRARSITIRVHINNYIVLASQNVLIRQQTGDLGVIALKRSHCSSTLQKCRPKAMGHCDGIRVKHISMLQLYTSHKLWGWVEELLKFEESLVWRCLRYVTGKFVLFTFVAYVSLISFGAIEQTLIERLKSFWAPVLSKLL